MILRVCRLLAVACLLQAPPAMAAAPVPAPAWVHTAWTARDGAPSNATSIAQTSDGWLWFASSAGLYRFDGVTFELVDAVGGQKLLSSNILAVTAYKDQLWVGYQFGGISVFEHGKVRHYGGEDGLPAGAIFRITYDNAGAMWMSGSAGLAWLDGTRWRALPAVPGPAGRALILRAPDGALWARSEQGLFRCEAATKACRAVLSTTGLEMVAFRPDGAVWIGLAGDGYYEFSGADAALRKLAIKGVAGIGDAADIDGRGNLWIGTGRAVLKVDAELQVAQTLTEASGFSNVNLTALLDDREGNLWFSTLAGVDRLRPPKLNAIELPAPRGVPGVVAGDAGAVWISAVDGMPATAVGRDGVRTATTVDRVTASYRQPDGAIWLGRAGELVNYAAGKEQRWPLPQALRDQPVQAMTMGPDGALWVSVARHGVHSFKDGRWTVQSGQRGLPASAAIAMLAGEAGVIWLGYPQGKLARVEGGGARLFGPADGVDIGNVLALSQRGRRLWLGGEKGLAYFDGGKFQRLTADDGEPLRGISGLVETASGELWAHGVNGISRIGAADLNAALAGATGAAHRRLFDYREGLEGAAPQIRPLPSLIEAGDGRLWYSTYSSVGWIDPAHLQRNQVAPAIALRGLTAGGRHYAPDQAPTLPPGTDAAQIDYTALSFSMPERVRFRYRLDGVDSAWQDAGARRTAYYNSLGPGDYSFRVAAVNEDDVATTREASLRFRIAPTLTQSPWFRGLLGVLVLAGLWALHAYRVGRVARRARILLEERVGERSRIARELHDTLLQSMQATILKVHAAALSVPAENPALRRSIEASVNEAQQALAEGRDRIQDLRSEAAHDTGGDFAAALRCYGEALQVQYPPARFALRESGRARALRPTAHEELLAMTREALLNAFTHAGAGTISVELDYAPWRLRVVVRDDGAGMPHPVAEGQRFLFSVVLFFKVIGFEVRIFALLILEFRL